MGKIEMTQYLRPNGIPRKFQIDLDDNYIEKAKYMIFSCELDSLNNVILYGKYKWQTDENELIEIAKNDNKDPENKLKKIIDKIYEKEKFKSDFGCYKNI